ncbi:MAG: Pyrrolidone-carboxylate peptidase [Candidatus Erwinia impunctatus]|nr:Pyrrolidone-carboxylate peptidase [Culicoides impunctatus]
MKTVLLTGFSPFGGESINPSWQAVSQLNKREIAGARVVVQELPCEFGRSIEILCAELETVQPDIVITVGQAGGRAEITVERVAINIDDARIADNAGNQPVDQPVRADGPSAYFTTLPLKSIVHELCDAGIPASVSQSAGTFVCNHIMYGLLDYIAAHLAAKQMRGGFIHIPYMPEQAVYHPGVASMSVSQVVAALEIAIAVAVTVEEDICIEGGATH